MEPRAPSLPTRTSETRTMERLAQNQGRDIRRIKFPTMNRLMVPQENRRSPFGPVAIQGTLKLGDCLIGPQVWGAANLAVFTPFDIQTDIVTLIAIIITTISAGTCHMDVGVYDTSGALKVSSGSEVLAVGGEQHRFTIAETQLQEGSYYLGASIDSVVPKVYIDPGYPSSFAMVGAKQMASAFPLPALAVLVDLVTGGGMVVAALQFKPQN